MSGANRRRQEGMALFLSVMMLVFMTAIALAALQIVSTDGRVAGLQNRSRSAFYAAEAAASEARALVRNVSSRTIVPTFYDPGTPKLLGDSTMYDREARRHAAIAARKAPMVFHHRDFLAGRLSDALNSTKFRMLNFAIRTPVDGTTPAARLRLPCIFCTLFRRPIRWESADGKKGISAFLPLMLRSRRLSSVMLYRSYRFVWGTTRCLQRRYSLSTPWLFYPSSSPNTTVNRFAESDGIRTPW